MSLFNIGFENYESQAVIENLVDIASKYDIYNFIARVAGLNLLSTNQNKSVLTDTLLQCIISRPRECYNSRIIISDKKFNAVVGELENTFLSASIDPCENTFVQNVMFNGKNYRVYNGIDITPAYNLQSMIRVLFYYKNQFDTEYLERVFKLYMLLLGISEEVVLKTGVSLATAEYDESHSISIPSGDIIRKYAEYVCIPINKVEKYIDGSFSINDLVIDIGVEGKGDIDNRPFYTRPFLRDIENGNIIVLNISLLPTFAIYKALEWAEEFSIKDELINRYNDYIWHESKIKLSTMGHKKIDESAYGLQCISNEYYKEAVLTVYNNQLLFSFYVCDDGYCYSKKELHSKYPDNRHQKLLLERLKYFHDNLKKLGIHQEDTYVIILLSSIGRTLSVRVNDDLFGYKSIFLYPFDLYCIAINETENTGFLPRYIRAKSQLNISLPDLFSELNSINIYTSNNYSFYMSDDVELDETTSYFAPGDSVEYISEALKKENRILVESYNDRYMSEVVFFDKKRNIYREVILTSQKHIALYISYDNIKIWIKTDDINDIQLIDIYYSLTDAISYWLAECKSIIELYDFPFKTYTIHISLFEEAKEYYRCQNISPFEECIGQKIEKNHIFLIFKPEAFGNMNQATNAQEKELCRYILDIFDHISFESRNYSRYLDVIFHNPLKKKFFSADYGNVPYFRPLVVKNNRIVRKEDEDYLSGIIGKEILRTEKWSIGIIDDSQRNILANAVVSNLYNRLEIMVAEFESDHIIEIIYHDLEETLYRLMLAERMYYSDIACYPEKERQYIDEYNDLNKTSLALKFLIEYVTARQPEGEKHFGIGQYEELIAVCAMIIDWAYKSDLFNYGIINTPVEILKSKRIGMKHDEFIDMYQYSNTYRRTQLSYNSSASLRKNYPMQKLDYADELDLAFISEFGYSYADFVKVVATMVALNENDIICVPKAEAIKQLKELDSSLSEELIINVFKDITYCPRKDYLKPPNGYDKEDAYPWRFNRRYSFNRRPVLQRGESVIWGNRQLYHMLEYLTDLIFDEKFKAKSEGMKILCGKIANSKGVAFNALIVDMIRDMRVFTVYPNIHKINGKRIAEKGDDLGDIDILIIDKEMQMIIVTEVKNFRFSRNPREINIEYEKMFVDKHKTCFATKHSKRVQWIRNHILDVIQGFKLENVMWNVTGLFIVNQPLISKHIFKQQIKCISKTELCIEAIRSVY